MLVNLEQYLCCFLCQKSCPGLFRKVDNAIQQINHYPANSVVCFVNTYPLDSDLSVG